MIEWPLKGGISGCLDENRAALVSGWKSSLLHQLGNAGRLRRRRSLVELHRDQSLVRRPQTERQSERLWSCSFL